MITDNARRKGERAADTTTPKYIGKTELPEKEGASPADTVPGWTIMRPLRKKGNKASGMGTKGASNANGNGASFDSQSGDDLKMLKTNDTGDGYGGVGEVETLHEVRSEDELLEGEDERGTRHNGQHAVHNLQSNGALPERTVSGGVRYKVYKRRWFGLVQLILLNIIVSWDWLSFSANSTTTAQYYNVSETAVNWLSTGFLFAFVAISPLTIYILNRGPKLSIMTAAVLILLGNWIRYGATQAGPNGNYGALMFGQILCGFSQPFVLAAPTRYSDLWFTSRGRVAATAVMSLANPFGGALAQLIDPLWASDGKPQDIPNMVLYIAIIASVAAIPAFFIPSHPPTPSSASGEVPKQQIWASIRSLLGSPEFYMIMIPFVIYVGLFNSISSLINQILAPYGVSETDAGIAGAILIVVGLVAAAITSPIIDKTKAQLLTIKICVPVLALCYLAYTFVPSTRELVGSYVVLAVMGAASFSLVPVVLEYLIEITHPISPEVTSTICWTGGQLTGGIFILISDALRAGGESDGTADDGTKRPPGNMYRALVFQAVIAMVVFPLPLALGLFGRHKEVRMRRVEADEDASQRNDLEG